jgi:putative transcriptional regulator
MRKASPPPESPAGNTAPTIYNRLPVLRVERGLSRQQLAEALGVNYQTVGYLERSEYNPSLELAFRISELFSLPIEAIFSRQPFKPMSEELYGRSANTPEKENPP